VHFSGEIYHIHSAASARLDLRAWVCPGVTVTQSGAPVRQFPSRCPGGLVSSMLSFLMLMLMLPGMATVAAYATVAVSVWLEERRDAADSAVRVEARQP
jgi:hypothetical protein